MMNLDAIVKAYGEAVFDTNKETAFDVVDAALRQGMTAEEVVFYVVIPATEELMAAITRDPDANLAQHFMTAQIAGEVTDKMLAKFERPPETIGRVVIGSSHGDLHSLGKRIVSGCLKAMMIDVVDLGVNVPGERFVDEAVAEQAQVIAISSMMVHTAIGEDGCCKVRALLRERELEPRIKVAVGGAPYRFDEELYRKVGADAWAVDGVVAGKMIVQLIKEARP